PCDLLKEDCETAGEAWHLSRFTRKRRRRDAVSAVFWTTREASRYKRTDGAPWLGATSDPHLAPSERAHADRERHQSRVSRLFRAQRPRGRRLEPARAAQRPDPALHQCRDGAVQERLHRAREARLPTRRHVAEMRARRRQAQRSGECRLHGAPPYLLRDAR